MVDLWTHEYIIFSYRIKRSQNQSKAEILTVQHSVDERNNLLIIFEDGGIQMINLVYRKKKVTGGDGLVQTEVEPKSEVNSTNKIQVLETLWYQGLANFRDVNVDVLVSGNSVTLIHLLNIQPLARGKDPKSLAPQESKFVVLEIEICKQPGNRIPRITSESFVEENLPSTWIKEPSLLKGVKLKASLV